MNRRTQLHLASTAILASAVALSGCAVAQEPWPNLNEAEEHLRLALDALNRAPDRFGGHKAAAQRLIRDAMAEIEQSKRSFR